LWDLANWHAFVWISVVNGQECFLLFTGCCFKSLDNNVQCRVCVSFASSACLLLHWKPTPCWSHVSLTSMKGLLKLPKDRALHGQLESNVRRLLSTEKDRDVSAAIRVTILELDRTEVMMESVSRCAAVMRLLRSFAFAGTDLKSYRGWKQIIGSFFSNVSQVFSCGDQTDAKALHKYEIEYVVNIHCTCKAI